MIIETIDEIAYPLDTVYGVMRDDLPKLVPFLPQVKYIEVLSREDSEPGSIRIVNKWQGTLDQAPRVARPFLKEEMVAWKDHARWVDADHRVEWRFESLVGDRYFDCNGENFFEAVGEGSTRVKITGELKVHPERLPGVPKFLARKVAPAVEKYIINLITPNLRNLAQGVRGYLDSIREPA